MANRFPKAVRALCATSLLATLAFGQETISDNISTTSGKRVRGVEIQSMGASEVRFLQSGAEASLPSASISGVDWHSPPEAFLLGQAAASSGKFADAANLYEEAVGKTERAPLKLEARFLAAQALLRSAGQDASRASAAADKLKSFLSDAPEHFRSAEAQLELGQAQLLAGQAEAAERTMSALSQTVTAQSLDLLWDVRAKFAVAKAQLAQGKLNESRASFRRAKNAAESLVAQRSDTPQPELQAIIAESVVGEGETFVAEKNHEEALRYFERYERDNNTSIAAAAKAGKGQALFLRAEQTSQPAALRAAQIALAEANVMDPLAGPTTAKALYYSGKVILALGSERESSDFAARAADYFQSVVQNYSDTAWAPLAAAELKR